MWKYHLQSLFCHFFQITLCSSAFFFRDSKWEVRRVNFFKADPLPTALPELVCWLPAEQDQMATQTTPRKEVQKSTKNSILWECCGSVRSGLEASNLFCHISTTPRHEPQSLITGEGLVFSEPELLLRQISADGWSSITSYSSDCNNWPAVQLTWWCFFSWGPPPRVWYLIALYSCVLLQNAFSGATANLLILLY